MKKSQSFEMKFLKFIEKLLKDIDIWSTARDKEKAYEGSRTRTGDCSKLEMKIWISISRRWI
jgi:hypothetical protein